jgi:hypothetical protein
MGLVLVAEKVANPKLFAAFPQFAFLLDRAQVGPYGILLNFPGTFDSIAKQQAFLDRR